MKVIYTLFNQASGKIAGVVASKNRGGNYMRSRVIPSNPRDTQQTRIRAILASLASFWRSGLTGTQRDNWNLLGNDQVTGENRFVAANSVLLQGHGTRVADAPASAAGTFTPFTPTTTTPTAGELNVLDDGSLNWNPANATDSYQAAAGGVVNFYVTRPQSASRFARQYPYSWIASKVRGGSATSGAQAVTLPFTPTAGQVVYVRCTSVGADGKLAIPAEIRVDVAAA